MSLELVKPYEKPEGPVYGRSPGMMVLDDIRAMNCQLARSQSAEATRLRLCIGYWKRRQVTGWLAAWYIPHNWFCQSQINFYRLKLNNFITKGII